MECRLDPATHHSISVQIVNRPTPRSIQVICGTTVGIGEAENHHRSMPARRGSALHTSPA